MREQSKESVATGLVLTALAGAAAALSGAYWDDAWHTNRGRDSFFIAPHIAIYAGITIAGAALAAALVLAIRRRGRSVLREERPLALALLAVSTTLAAAPVDNIWHVAFGRDAVLWSPPHVLGIVGSAGLGVAVLAVLARADAPWARCLRPVAGGFVLAAFNFLVIEFESDVPRFPVLWYLPALVTASALALALVRLVGRERFAATEAAVAHLVFVGAVSIYLLVLGFDAPKLPLLALPALVLDLAAQRSTVVRGVVYSLAIYLVYVPTSNWLGSGIEVTASDVAIGLPVAAAAATVVLFLVRVERPRVPRLRFAHVFALVALLSLTLALPAYAHDPGQGDPAGAMAFRVDVRAQVARVEAEYLNQRSCQDIAAARLVARRAGTTVTTPVTMVGCRYTGRLELPDRGRWFIYVDLQRGDQRIESWLPVKLEADQKVFQARNRYAYYATATSGGVAETVGGIFVYAVALAFLTALVALARRERLTRPQPQS